MSAPHSQGKIEVVTGCMFAGKTEEIMRRLRRAEIANCNIEVFTPHIDDRFDREIIGSHNGKSWEATVVEMNQDGLETMREASEADIIAVDEFNFFEPEFIPVLQALANSGVRVIVSGLDQNFRGEAFSPMDTLMAVADEVDKLSAICEVCGQDATRTQRLVDGDPAAFEEPTIQVGGEEAYQARCRDCHALKGTLPNDSHLSSLKEPQQSSD